jgi:hypothetical protein
MNELLLSEKNELCQHEAVIEQGLKTFVDVGNALLAIRDKRLYRQDFGTFEDYCQSRWSMSRVHAHRMMEAATVTNNLLPIGNIPLPATESQARPLTKLEPEMQQVVWQRAVETAPNGKVTAAHVEATARVFVSPVSPQPVAVAPVVVPNEYEEMADELEEDEDGYDWTEDSVNELDTVTITDAGGWEETITVRGGIASVTEALEIAHEVKQNGMAVHFSSESPEHYTPKKIIDAAIAVMGGIDLDPCSNSKTAPNVPALDHFTIADDGLSLPWFGRVYLNPPYGRVIGDWTGKLMQEYDAGNVTEAIALVPGRIDTQWWQALGDKHHACFYTGRLTFIGNNDPAPFPSTIFYLGEDAAKFFSVFSAIGQIWKRIDEHWFTD